MKLTVQIFLAFAFFLILGGSAKAQCANTGFSDGCSGAPTGTPQFQTLLDAQTVVQLNIIGGSGYTAGTYTWAASGCNGSGATGTVTVASGKVGGSTGQEYTISNQGSGYTCRPTIALPSMGSGSGASIIPSVYQVRPAWNVPGVDYYVGIPTGTVLKDPTTSGNLPTGATLSGSTVKITGCNVTLNGLDFTLHNDVIVVDVSGSNCVTIVENSNFQANGTALQTIANLTSLGTGGSFVFLQNNYNGLAATGGSGSGFAVNDPIQGQGIVTLKYNYFHNFDSKIIQLSGASGNPMFTEEYNLFANFGYCGTNGSGSCSHGEAEYTYGGAPNGLTVDFAYNTYLVTFTNSGLNDLTAPHAVQADDVNIVGATDTSNVILAPGPGGTCSSSNNDYSAAAAVFDGDQEGGTLSNTNFTYDYIDNSATFFPWYHAGGTGLTYVNNIDTGSGAGCGNVGTAYATVPTALHTTSVTSSSIALDWTAAEAGSSALSGYHIYRNGTLLTSTASTSYTDSTVSSGTTYYYTVAAYDSAGNIGAQSGFISAAPGGSSQAPNPPTSLTVIQVTPGQ